MSFVIDVKGGEGIYVKTARPFDGFGVCWRSWHLDVFHIQCCHQCQRGRLLAICWFWLSIVIDVNTVSQLETILVSLGDHFCFGCDSDLV